MNGVAAIAARRTLVVLARRSGGESGDKGAKGLSEVRRWLRVMRMAEGGKGVERAVWTSCWEEGEPVLNDRLACERKVFLGDVDLGTYL